MCVSVDEILSVILFALLFICFLSFALQKPRTKRKGKGKGKRKLRVNCAVAEESGPGAGFGAF